MRQMLKRASRGGKYMKFYAAYVPVKEYWIVLSGDNVVQNDLSEDAASRLVQFMNAAEYLNTDQKQKFHRPVKVEFDFDSIYAEYPRKIGKKTGYERLRKKITTIEKFNLFCDAVRNYVKMTAGQEEKYILHFSSFVNRWEDFIPEDHIQTEAVQTSIDDITKLMDH